MLNYYSRNRAKPKMSQNRDPIINNGPSTRRNRFLFGSMTSTDLGVEVGGHGQRQEADGGVCVGVLPIHQGPKAVPLTKLACQRRKQIIRFILTFHF